MKLEISIEVKFGSDFQRDVSTEMLVNMLDVWRQVVEKHHKKNKVAIYFKDALLQSVKYKKFSKQ